MHLATIESAEPIVDLETVFFSGVDWLTLPDDDATAQILAWKKKPFSVQFIELTERNTDLLSSQFKYGGKQYQAFAKHSMKAARSGSAQVSSGGVSLGAVILLEREELQVARSLATSVLTSPRRCSVSASVLFSGFDDPAANEELRELAAFIPKERDFLEGVPVLASLQSFSMQTVRQ